MQGEAVETAGLRKSVTYERSEDSMLRLHTTKLPDPNPMFHRVVGKHGVQVFELQ